MTVPQVYLDEPEELALHMVRDQKKSKIFMPLLVKLGLAILLSAMGAPETSLLQVYHQVHNIQDQAMAQLPTVSSSLKDK